MSPISLKALSVLRMLVGTSCLVIPRQIGPLVGVSVAPEAVVFARLVGIRDFVLGAYLWKRVREWEAAQTVGGTESQRAPLIHKRTSGLEYGNITSGIPQTVPNSEAFEGPTTTTLRQNMCNENLRSAVWLGLICDGVDIASCLVCTIEGNLSDLAKITLGGGAFVAAAIGPQHLL
ncbi:uncharacterized protein Z518_09685 [Rhinocladiella mackenziei CBS 650.93]|uniref:Uncharacterized protein n=1 Tax=Rhinocladiella mackenziei CBS 650.93 TaxID=1442369 RepID=A0A0D2IV90_9EURO|nr:uncharacterized protein Z518_09685 [Rhinocladiella mackenziei CBS 650.93]KIX00620.1 hypothetical protein Z518_09685 [Rhinocladiella mackenziei CBS 650.93]